MSQAKKDSTKQTKITSKHGVRRLFATGFSMGTADLVPGVSGGTIAFLFGIYEELLFSIKTVTGTTLSLALRGKFKAAWASVPFHFLVPLFFGITVAIFGLANLISYLLDNYDVFVWSFFFGLVLASAFVIRKRISHWSVGRVAAVVVGATITFGVVGLASGSMGGGPFILFITGMIAFSALILPGISGSLIMVILGQYERVLEAVSNFNFGTIFFVALGGAVGLALFARVLTWLFRHYYGVVIAFLIGMMLGSLRSVWPWREAAGPHSMQNVLPPLDWMIVLPILLAVAGFMVILRLQKLGLTKEHIDDIEDKAFKKEYQESLRNS